MIYSLAIYKKEKNYKNKKNIIIILPFAQDETGLRLSLNKTYVLEEPYDIVLLGRKTKEAFEYAIKETPWKGPGEDALGKALGIKSGSKFVREWLRVWAGLDEDKKAYSFLPGKRERGGYSGVKCDEDLYTIPLSASEEEIGELILKAFENSI